MKHFIDEIPKINLNKIEIDNKRIAAFVCIYLSPILLIGIHIKSENILVYIECFYYLTSMFMAEQLIFKERKKNYRCFKKRIDRYFILISMSIITCFAGEIILSILSNMIAKGISSNQESILEDPIIVILILACIYAPVVEETVFRYVIRKFIKNDMAFILISGTIFGLVHVLSSIPSHSLLEVIAYCIPHLGVGLYLAYIYVTTNSLETCIITHRGINILASFPIVLLYLYR